MDRLRLIAAIFVRPALWDLQGEEHKSRSNVPALWKEVADSMGPDVTVDECKRKWKNLRDAYRAEIKRIELRIEKDLMKGKYDPKNDYSSKWAYFEHLKFIKDIRKPRRRHMNVYLTSSSKDNFCDDNESEQFSELYNVDNAKIEQDLEEENNINDSQSYSEQSLKDAEKLQEDRREKPSQPPAIKLTALSQNFSKVQKDTDNRVVSTRCNCNKRSYDQMQFLEDLEKEEQHLIKSTRVEIRRSTDLAHVGDSDYNFLVSFLPQMKKMNELQNLKFRAKISDFIFTLMSQSQSNIANCSLSLQSKS